MPEVTFEHVYVTKVDRKQISLKTPSNVRVHIDTPDPTKNPEVMELLLRAASGQLEGGLTIVVDGFNLKSVTYPWVQHPKKLVVKA
jgi:hypothetical protein